MLNLALETVEEKTSCHLRILMVVEKKHSYGWSQRVHISLFVGVTIWKVKGIYKKLPDAIASNYKSEMNL